METDLPTAFAPRLDLDQGTVEEVVSLTVNGALVCGNLVRPAQPRSVGVVLVHGWSGYRSGPHGVLTCLGRELAAAGYPTLRFDFRGRGESGGDGLESTLVTMADDLVAASAWLATRCGVERLVYLGLCSGGNVTIGTLPRLPLARGLILLSVYPFSDGDAFGRDVHRTWHYGGVYLRKALQGDTWRRLCRGDVHLSQVANVLFGHFLKKGRNRRKEGDSAATATAPAPPPSGAAGLGRTAKATATESRGQAKEPPKKHLANLRPDLPALMVYGTADPDAPAALTYFGDYARAKKLPVTFLEIPDASHNFPSMALKAQLAQLATDFLQRLPER
jgi:pimeloyl-ACP methyl ester carboxylesterase